VLSKAHTRQQGLGRKRSFGLSRYRIKRTPSITLGRGGRWRGVVARAKQSRDGDGDEKGGEACGRDACGGIGGGTCVHAIMANVEGPLYLAVSHGVTESI